MAFILSYTIGCDRSDCNAETRFDQSAIRSLADGLSLIDWSVGKH